MHKSFGGFGTAELPAPQASAVASMASGLGCVGCPSAQGETLEQAAMVHGLNADEVLANVNDWIRVKEPVNA